MGFVGMISLSKKEQIMSRYRPIAPKPLLVQTPAADNSPLTFQSPTIPSKPSYFKGNTGRSKKRTREKSSPLAAPFKNRSGNLVPQMPQLGAQHGFGFHSRHFPVDGESVSLPNLTYMTSGVPLETDVVKITSFLEQKINEYLGSHQVEVAEKDILRKLQVPIPTTNRSFSCGRVIIPRPVRPVSSSITVDCITPSVASDPALQRPEEVEDNVEMQSLPLVVSDSKNKVRFTNSAYKELVGQPECLWLDSVDASKRLGGEVMLDIPNSHMPIPSNGFSCRAKIEWACNGHKIFMVAPCVVVGLHCKAKDYLFTWRFNTTNTLGPQPAQ